MKNLIIPHILTHTPTQTNNRSSPFHVNWSLKLPIGQGRPHSNAGVGVGQMPASPAHRM